MGVKYQMYLPAHFEVTDKNVLHDVIANHPLGTWVVSNGNDLLINHIPFLLDESKGTHGVLIGHVARANPVWTQLDENTKSAVVFQAEQGYVSPNWYASKRSDGRVVPTWNYSVVHVHGTAKTIEDKDSLLQIVSALTDQHEANQTKPWRVSDAPADYVDKLLGSIVGIEIRIDSITGKFKLSQNRSADDREGVIAGLQDSNESEALDLVRRMLQSGK